MKPNLTRIVVIMPEGDMKWADVMRVDHDIFAFQSNDFSFPVVFDGLGIDYFIVT